MTGSEILDIPMVGEWDGYTVRDYLKELLTKLWEHGEGFSGKRPFGNSGWEYDLYYPLVASGKFKGTYEIDEDGYADAFDYDVSELNEAIFDSISAL